MVAAKLERIRVIARARRSQRSEVCNEIRVVMDMDLPLSRLEYLPGFGEACGFRYEHDARGGN